MNINHIKYVIVLSLLTAFSANAQFGWFSKKAKSADSFSVLEPFKEIFEDDRQFNQKDSLLLKNCDFDSVNIKPIFIKDDYEFEKLIDKYESFRKSNIRLLNHLDALGNKAQSIYFFEFNYRLVVEVHKRLLEIYYTKKDMERVSYSAWFLVAAKEFHNDKANILVQVLSRIKEISDNADRKNVWLSISRIMREIDINNLSGSGKADNDNPYDLSMSKPQIISLLNDVVNSESNDFVKNYAKAIVSNFFNKDSMYDEPSRSEIIYSAPDDEDLPDKKARLTQAYFDSAFQADNNHDKIKYYTKTIQSDSNFTSAWFNRGTAYNEMSRFKEAAPDFNWVIQKEPRNTQAYMYRGIALLKMELYAEAVDDFSRLFKLDPQRSAEALANRGLCYQKMGSYAKAVIDYSVSLELNPNDIITLNNRGLCLSNLKKYKDAVKDHQQAIKIQPENAVAYYNLGCNYWQLNKMDDVVKSWEKCLVIDPEYAPAKTNLEQARKLAAWQKQKKKKVRRIKN